VRVSCADECETMFKDELFALERGGVNFLNTMSLFASRLGGVDGFWFLRAERFGPT